MTKSLLPLLSGLLFATALIARDTYPLNEGWRSVCYPEGGADSLEIFRQTLPHNWDDYYGYRQYTHGNLHGTARYERHFTLSALTHQTDAAKAAQQLYTLRLEGAGSYVSVWVNGKEICTHRPAGRVVTSLNITEALHLENPSAQNNLVILCEHPSNITDLPWVCGGCSSEWGFSEGSAPFGLFRSVSLEVTDPLRVEPFGVHAWANEALDTVWVETEIRNYSNYGQSALIQTVIEGRLRREPVQLGAHLSATVRQAIPMEEVKLQPWSPAQPQLYTVTTTLMHGTQHELADKVQTTVGFNSIKWPRRTADGRLADYDHRFYVNGEPTYLHGVCEYEHLFGQSHALTDEEIDYRCNLIRHLGFNAVRDAHQPHHLRYGENYAQQGVLWWPQFSAHIWYDTPQFRENFKTLLRQWVRERRNNPAVILWGLQNESTLPEDFARECSDIIREMDPKARGQRLITTCNGGSGTDWNVIQNWSGTYGGRLEDYARELSQDDQLLNGEYGGWRTVGLHDRQSEQALRNFDPKAPWSEEHQCALLHAKLSQAYLASYNVCGQFQWILASHDNPGRQQPDEFLRLIDKVGPFNYKGILDARWEPTDAYYLYLAWGAYLRGEWPVAQLAPWDLTARQMIELGYRLEQVPLPDYLLTADADGPCDAPQLHAFGHHTQLLKPDPERVYLYRYNCGGDALTDSYGQRWMGDDTRYSYSWAMAPQFAADSLCPVLASQGMVPGWAVDSLLADGEPLLAAQADQPLLRSYRYGRHELRFSFPLPYGPVYQVELWFVDSHHRVSHVQYLTRAVWDGQLTIGFPAVKVGQARVSAIAISLLRRQARKLGKLDSRSGRFCFKEGLLEGSHPSLTQSEGYPYSQGLTWADLDKQVLAVTDKSTLPADKGGRPSSKFGVEEGQTSGQAAFGIQMGLAQEYAMRFRYKNTSNPNVRGHWQLLAQQDGRLVAEGDITFPQTPNKFKVISTTTGTFVNAGHYRLVVTGASEVEFESVEIQ